MTIKIFLSYSWKDKLEADRIDNYLTNIGYYVQRDIREIGYKRNIKEFMKSIGNSDFVIPLISDTFLRSHKCMYEILELTRSSDYKERVMQIILNSAKIFKPIDRAAYLEYWSRECTKLEDVLKANIPENAKADLQKDFSDYKNIEKTIYDFTSFLSEENGVTLTDLEASDYKAVIDYIDKKYHYNVPLKEHKADVAPLRIFQANQTYYGIIKAIYNYGFLVQIHTEQGFRDGILHKYKLKDCGYIMSQLKRFYDVGDEIHIKLSEINYQTKAAFGTGGLGFTPTEIFHKKLEEKISQYLLKAKDNNEEIINLSGFALSKIPKEISEIKSLKRIFLTGNKFTDMPRELDLLPNLKTVFCDFKPSRRFNFDYVLYS